MKVEALFNREGVILAAIAYEASDSRPRPRPMPAKATLVGVFDIPDQCANMPLDELCARMRVDKKRRQLVEASAQPRRQKKRASGDDKKRARRRSA